MKDQKTFFCISRREKSRDLLSKRLFLCLVSSFLDQIYGCCLCQVDFILLHHLDALIEGEKALSSDAAIDLRRILARVLGELIRIHLFFVIVVFRNNFHHIIKRNKSYA